MGRIKDLTIRNGFTNRRIQLRLMLTKEIIENQHQYLKL